ncbi:GNAT family N-acetyltransferase [Tenacibaculum maritimum]|uniref:GNAT family N-acetyltransferase n=1 Tax=Tenacibaculum maritimum TaxID=107401 RepID=UPI0038767A97
MITGKNIGLRAVEKEDLPYLRDWRNIPNFRKHFREVRELSLTDQEAWFESLQKTKHINYMFTIVDLKTNRPIGAGGILYINWIIRSGDFSFYIGEDEMYIGNDGKAKEAAELLIDYGFKNLNLHKIWMELYEFDTQKIDFFKNYFVLFYLKLV